MGFEPMIHFWRIHTFQACAFDHSAISPVCNVIRWKLFKIVCKSINFFNFFRKKYLTNGFASQVSSKRIE